MKHNKTKTNKSKPKRNKNIRKTVVQKFVRRNPTTFRFEFLLVFPLRACSDFTVTYEDETELYNKSLRVICRLFVFSIFVAEFFELFVSVSLHPCFSMGDGKSLIDFCFSNQSLQKETINQLQHQHLQLSC